MNNNIKEEILSKVAEYIAIAEKRFDRSFNLKEIVFDLKGKLH